MPRFMDSQDSWAAGLITNPQPDTLPPTAYSHAVNMQLRNLGGGKAILGTRPGFLQHNTTRISAHTCLGMIEYRRYASGAFTGYHVVNTSEGKFKLIASNGTVTDASATATPFTAGAHYPDYAQANNLLFIVNGQENKKYNGTAVQNVGGADPSAPTVADNGAAGNPDGTYDFAVTHYNSATGYETSRSGYNSVTVVTNKIDVSWTAPSDSQFDYVRVYIRKGTLSGSFYRLTVATTPATDATHEGFAVATTSCVVDITDAQFTALTTLAPTTTENDKPPVLDRIEFHQDRLFGVDPTDPSVVLFSKLSTDTAGVEAFDPNNYIPVALNDGDRITALSSANQTQLLIFKKNSIYCLEGIYPDWELRTVSANVGATSHLSLVVYNKMCYFWSLHGPAVTDGQTVDLLAQPDIADLVAEDELEFDLLNLVVAGYDDTGHRILWAIPGDDESRNTLVLPFNLILNKFEAGYWEMIDIASMCNVLDADLVPRLYFGDYKGRTFKFSNSTFNDGVASGTTTGSPTSCTSTVLTDSGASFLTTGTGLAELYVIVKDAHGDNVQRKRVASNTGTALTLDSGETFDPVPDTTWTYHIGAIDATFRFGFKDGQGTPFMKKQLEYVILDVVPPETALELHGHVLTNTGTLEFDVETTVFGGVWDQSEWDEAVWGGELTLQHFRKRLGGCSRTYAIELNACVANGQFAIARMAVVGRTLTEKT